MPRVPPVTAAVRQFVLRVVIAILVDRAAWRGAVLSSWHRTPDENAAAGGLSNSQHLVGTAWDVVTPNPDRVVDAGRLAGLDAIDEGTHVHLELRPAEFVSA